MSQITNYTEYFDSNSRKAPSSGDNSTNDIVLEMTQPVRGKINEIRFSSLEIPLAQYTIEKDWSRFYFDEGIEFINSDPFEPRGMDMMFMVTLTIQHQGQDYELELPWKNNFVWRIVAQGDNYTTDPNLVPTYKKFVFTTAYRHHLYMRYIFDYQYPQLISTPLNDTDYGEVTRLSPDNPNLTIIDDYNLMLDFSDRVDLLALHIPQAVHMDGGGIHGWVLHPVFAGPQTLAAYLHDSLNLLLPNTLDITYHHETGKFVIRYLKYRLEPTATTTIRVPQLQCLAGLLGLGNNDRVIQWHMESTHSWSFPENFQCSLYVEIPTGNYTALQLSQELAWQFNRFYFDCGECQCSLPGTHDRDIIFFYFTDQCGDLREFMLSYGQWSPYDLAFILSYNMSFWQPIECRFDPEKGIFVFTSAQSFGIEWNLMPLMAKRMGFSVMSTRNQNTYQSDQPFHYPFKTCCLWPNYNRNGNIVNMNGYADWEPSPRVISYIYSPHIIPEQNRFTMQINKTRSFRTRIFPGYSYEPFYRLDSMHFPQNSLNGFLWGNGFQNGDVLRVQSPKDGKWHTFVMARRLVGYALWIWAGSVSRAQFFRYLNELPPNVDDQMVCVGAHDVICSNLYWVRSDPLSNQASRKLARILGFDFRHHSYARGDIHWLATGPFTLDWPAYLLVELHAEPFISRQLHQDAESKDPSVLRAIITKCILYPQYRDQIFIPNFIQPWFVSRLSKIRIRLLNPDHTLYHLHQREWSFSLTFVIQQDQIHIPVTE
jgi:hypothetical protein